MPAAAPILVSRAPRTLACGPRLEKTGLRKSKRGVACCVRERQETCAPGLVHLTTPTTHDAFDADGVETSARNQQRPRGSFNGNINRGGRDEQTIHVRLEANPGLSLEAIRVGGAGALQLSQPFMKRRIEEASNVDIRDHPRVRRHVRELLRSPGRRRGDRVAHATSPVVNAATSTPAAATKNTRVRLLIGLLLAATDYTGRAMRWFRHRSSRYSRCSMVRIASHTAIKVSSNKHATLIVSACK